MGFDFVVYTSEGLYGGKGDGDGEGGMGGKRGAGACKLCGSLLSFKLAIVEELLPLVFLVSKVGAPRSRRYSGP